MPLFKTYLADLLIKRRQTLKLNQQALANLSGVNKRTIVQLENGAGNPSLDTLQQLLDILGLEIKFELKPPDTTINE